MKSWQYWLTGPLRQSLPTPSWADILTCEQRWVRGDSFVPPFPRKCGKMRMLLPVLIWSIFFFFLILLNKSQPWFSLCTLLFTPRSLLGKQSGVSWRYGNPLVVLWMPTRVTSKMIQPLRGVACQVLAAFPLLRGYHINSGMMRRKWCPFTC